MHALTSTFYQLLSDNLPSNAHKQALVDPAEDIDYASLASEVDRVGAYLVDQGIKRGDRVIVQLRKSISEVVAMFAIAKVGAVIVNVNAQWTLDQLAYVAKDCEAKLLITDSRIAKMLSTDAIPGPICRVLVHGNAPEADGFDSWDALGSGTNTAEVAVLDTDLAMIIYTSGSTGQPKGVMLSHQNIVLGARYVARYLKLAEDDRLISILAYNFDAGLNQLTTMMLLGGTVVHQPVIMATEIVRTIVDQRVTGLAGVPPLLSQVVRLLRENPVPMPALRLVTNTGGKIPLNILESMPEVFPQAEIFLMYGLTESFRSTYLAPEKFLRKMGAIGQAIPGAEVYVIKSGEGIAGPGEEGELVHRGPLVSMGYWGQSDLTRQKIRPCPELSHLIGDEPVVYSGDIIKIDEDGDLWFVSRNDTLIKTGGVRLSPDEVEDQVSRSGLVSDVVAYGVDDEDLGQVVHVSVTPLENFSEEALLKHCRRVMPSYMIPKEIHVWQNTMPRTASGKLDRPKIIRSIISETC